MTAVALTSFQRAWQNYQAEMHLRAVELSIQTTGALIEAQRAICDAWHAGKLVGIQNCYALLNALDYDDLLCDELESRRHTPPSIGEPVGARPARRRNTGRGGLAL